MWLLNQKVQHVFFKFCLFTTLKYSIKNCGEIRNNVSFVPMILPLVKNLIQNPEIQHLGLFAQF